MGVGLDIGSQSIKVAELEKKGDKYNLKSAVVVGYRGIPTINKMASEGEMAQMATIIKKLFKEAKISQKNVAISLPESLSFTRSIKFPMLTDQEIDSAVKWEADQYIPIPLSEAVYQHQIIERLEGANPPSVRVLLVAAPKKLVEKYIKIANMANLNVELVETELISLVRSLSPENETNLIVDIGMDSTNIAIERAGALTFSRTIATAGLTFTRAIAQGFGVSEAQAEEYKRTYGLSKTKLEGKVAAAIMPVFSIISEEIKKAIHFYQTQEAGRTPSTIILCGGSAGVLDITTELTKAIGIETVLGNPFVKVVVDPQKMKDLASYSPLYPIAVGLAMGMK